MTDVLMKGSASRRKLKRLLMRNYQLWLLLIPGLAATILFNYVPMYGVQIAFKNYRVSRGIWGSEWAGLSHFIRFFEYPGFWRILKNTLSITLYHEALFPLSIILALQINELRSQKFKRTIQMVSYAPYFLSMVVLCGMVLLFLDRSNGLVNNTLARLGLERIDFMSNPRMFASIYVWSGAWQTMGWGTIIYLGVLSSVSPELIEAAQIDGATKMQIIWHVNIPSILPTATILLILSTGSLLSVGHEKILLLQNDLNMESSRVISTYVYEMGLAGGQYSYSTGIGFLNNVINTMLVITVNMIVKRVSEVSLW